MFCAPPVDAPRVRNCPSHVIAITLLVLAVVLAAPLGVALADQQNAVAHETSEANAPAAGEVAGSSRHMRSLRQRGSQLRARVLRQELSIAKLQQRRDLAETRLDQARRVYERHIVDLYKAGDGASISILSEARSTSDAITRTQILRQLARSEQSVLQEVIDAAAAANTAAGQIDHAAAKLADDQAKLGAIHDQLVSFEQPTGPVSLDQIADEASNNEDPAPNARHFFASGPIPAIGYYGPGSAAAQQALPVVTTPTAGGGATPPGTLKPTGRIEAGIASWYGPGFHGKTTANGETYDQNAMTAAHPSLPFNTWVKVTAANGRSVLVRINDRGPYVGGRIIDLSHAASQLLGMDGTAAVQVEVMSS